MSEAEVKKSIFVGDTGNKAEITEENRPTNTEEVKHSKKLMERAAKTYCPLGADYLGFAVVFYYGKDSVAGNPQFFTACQTSVKEVPEQFADVGHKQLKTTLMNSYGRSQPKVRA